MGLAWRALIPRTNRLNWSGKLASRSRTSRRRGREPGHVVSVYMKSDGWWILPFAPGAEGTPTTLTF
ncbi:hypothetical protein IMZ48_45330 [Candidatus Bathyarchaeota archaeon]|nr:hypothetical protein [Candidatus Bathyarchaeota archaeon]